MKTKMDRMLETLEQKRSVPTQQNEVAEPKNDLPADVVSDIPESAPVEDSFDKDYEELLQLVSSNPTPPLEEQEPSAGEVSEPEDTFAKQEDKDEFDYKSLYETEAEKRMSFESEARQREIEAKYWREKFENE